MLQPRLQFRIRRSAFTHGTFFGCQPPLAAVRWTPMFEPLGAFFKLAFLKAAPVSFGSLSLCASFILERENDVA